MLSKLKLLDLADNRMRRICGIDHLKELVCLRMVGNRIKRIEGLSGCISLNVLVLGKSVWT